MIEYKEKFEKMRIAGRLASRTLDMLTEYIKPGISTDKIDQLGFEFNLHLYAIKYKPFFLASRKLL